jgi:hypothetical protein
MEYQLLKTHQTNMMNSQIISELKTVNSNLELDLRENLERAQVAEREKNELSKQFQNFKINNEIEINELKSKVNVY